MVAASPNRKWSVFLYFCFPWYGRRLPSPSLFASSCREHREMLSWREAEGYRSQGRWFRETKRFEIETKRLQKEAKSKLKQWYWYFKSPMEMLHRQLKCWPPRIHQCRWILRRICLFIFSLVTLTGISEAICFRRFGCFPTWWRGIQFGAWAFWPIWNMKWPCCDNPNAVNVEISIGRRDFDTWQWNHLGELMAESPPSICNVEIDLKRYRGIARLNCMNHHARSGI